MLEFLCGQNLAGFGGSSAKMSGKTETVCIRPLSIEIQWYWP
jgi:hypothetical protein